MFLCYIDESGTPDIPGNTSHFILAGLSIPIGDWKKWDAEIQTIKQRYGIENSELHVAWILRPYLEQTKITNFEHLSRDERTFQVQAYRTTELLRLQRSNLNQYKQTRKNYKHTEAYIHLSYAERRRLILEIASNIAGWSSARLFAECIDKRFFSPAKTGKTIDEQAFEQVVSRFETFLRIIGTSTSTPTYGLLIHDNNETVSRKHTDMMRGFHQQGTFWVSIDHIIETPLFVDSRLTSMVQVADLCGYALRRFLENDETDIFNLIYNRADRKDGVVVGVRHFTRRSCQCKICVGHQSL